MDEPRDTQLGTRLDELDVLEHGPGYWDGLEAAVTAHLGRHEGRDTGVAAVERYPTFGGGFTLLRRVWVAAAIGALVVFAAVFGAHVSRDEVRVGAEPASAAQAIRLSLAALARVPAVQGTVWQYMLDPHGKLGLISVDSVIATKDGSERRETVPGQPTIFEKQMPGTHFTTVYDARAHVFQALVDWADNVSPGNVTHGRRFRWMEQTGYPPGPPDQTERLLPFWQLRAYLRARLGDHHLALSTTTLNGHPVWVVSGPYVTGSDPGQTSHYGRFVVTIDAQTRLPRRVQYYASGGVMVLESVMDLAPLRRDVARSSFTLSAPPADQTYVDTWSQTLRFRPVPVDDKRLLARELRRLPVRPSWLPPRYVLEAAAVRREAGGEVRLAGGTRVSDTVASLVWQRGFDRVFISLRLDPRLDSTTTWSKDGGKSIRIDTSDPFIPVMGPSARVAWRAQTTTVLLRKGAFAGSRAHIVVDPQYWPHLWVKKRGQVATVAGNLSAAQMVAIAESLGPWSRSAGR